MTKGAQTRQHILEKAAPLFNQRGFAGCSMQELMTATGLEKGGLYRHFASKEELAVEAFKYALQQVIGARLGELASISGAIARLQHVVTAFVRIPSPVPGGCPLMNVAADADTCSHAIRIEAREAIGVWKSNLCNIMEHGKQTGELRPDLNPARTANAIISMLEGALVISRLEGTKQALFHAQDALNLMLAGLATNAGEQALPPPQ